MVKSTPPIDEYTIVLKTKPDKPAGKSVCNNKSLKILEPFGTDEYTISDLHYIVLPNQENSYNQASWSDSISNILYQKILFSLKEYRLFKSVTNFSSVATSDYILEMEINDFKQYFTNDLKSSYVLLDLTFTLINSKHFQIIAQKEFKKKVPTKSLDAKGGVDALNTAFNETVPEILTWLSGVCR